MDRALFPQDRSPASGHRLCQVWLKTRISCSIDCSPHRVRPRDMPFCFRLARPRDSTASGSRAFSCFPVHELCSTYQVPCFCLPTFMQFNILRPESEHILAVASTGPCRYFSPTVGITVHAAPLSQLLEVFVPRMFLFREQSSPSVFALQCYTSAHPRAQFFPVQEATTWVRHL